MFEQIEQEAIRATIFICAALILNCTVLGHLRSHQQEEECLEIVKILDHYQELKYSWY